MGKAQAHTTAEKVEVSKVQLLVSEHMFGQVVMRVYNGNLWGYGTGASRGAQSRLVQIRLPPTAV